MIEIRDSVNIQIDEYLKQNGKELIEQIKNDVFNKPNLMLIDSLISNNAEELKKKLESIKTLIKNTCEKYPLWELLTLFRYFSKSSLFFIDNYLTSEEQIMQNMNDILLIGTNYILKFSKNDENLQSCLERYKIIPSFVEMEDVCRVFIYSTFFVFIKSNLNPIIHIQMIENSQSIKELLINYYERQFQLNNYKKLITSVNNSLLITSFWNRSYGYLVYKNHLGKEYQVLIRDFIPTPISEEQEMLKYQKKDIQEFERITGISFTNWRKIWFGLNQVLVNNLLPLYLDGLIFHADNENLHACAERADDYFLTGLGSGVIESIVDSCYEILQQKYKDGIPSKKVILNFINYLSCKNLPGNPNFIEQPYIFYQIGGERVYWDYLRHERVMQALTRKLRDDFSGSERSDIDNLTRKVAKKIEEQLFKKTIISLEEVQEPKFDVRIKNLIGKNDAWQIDFGFIYKNIIFLVEVKDWIKPEKYHLLDEVAVSDRIQKFESQLKKQDRKLQQYKNEIRAIWRSSCIHGAICVVCTEEAEFVASSEQYWWLLKGKIPRICLIDELIYFLKNENVIKTTDHPCFVRFDS